MKKGAVYGVGFGINGREAAMQATQHALDQAGSARPVFGLALVAQEFDTSEALAGMLSLLGETPLWGFSTPCPLAGGTAGSGVTSVGGGDQPRSVVVALITGADVQAQVLWCPNYADEAGNNAADQLAAALGQSALLPEAILLAADGLQGTLEPVMQALAGYPVHLAGGLAAGDPAWGKTFCIGKNQSGAGALTAALLGGSGAANSGAANSGAAASGAAYPGALRLGVGLGHGWKDLGVCFRASRVQGDRLLALDERPAVETYARYFGYSAETWATAPLSSMARLYPLGIESSEANTPLLVRAVLRVEGDGALRMSGPIPEGALLHLMAGDPDACLEAAQTAAEDALRALYGRARPILALALVDTSWQTLFESRSNPVAGVLKSVLGEIPLIGAYTYGQLYRPRLSQPPVLHNQNIEVIVFGQG